MKLRSKASDPRLESIAFRRRSGPLLVKGNSEELFGRRAGNSHHQRSVGLGTRTTTPRPRTVATSELSSFQPDEKNPILASASRARPCFWYKSCNQ
jgi:hypothetical protein